MTFEGSAGFHVHNPSLGGHPVTVRSTAVSGCHHVTPISNDVDEPGARAQVVERASGEQDVLRSLLRPSRTRGRDLDAYESAEHPLELEIGIQIQVPMIGRLAEGAGLDIDDLDVGVTGEEAVQDGRP